jgi:hypothetical protein
MSVVVVFLFTSRIVTCAPGTSCPLESVMVPTTLPVATWAEAIRAGNDVVKSARRTAANLACTKGLAAIDTSY